jgi:hypothetical protein
MLQLLNLSAKILPARLKFCAGLAACGQRYEELHFAHLGTMFFSAITCKT